MRSVLLLLVFALAGVARATTVPPLTEAEQIARAALILRARADTVSASREATPHGSAIITTVRFTPLAVYKGTAPAELTLQFLGGRVDDVEMKVGSMPQFEAGAEYVLFVAADTREVCPLVAWRDGALPVDRSTDPTGTVLPPGEEGASIVIRQSRTLLPSPLPLAEFESRLRAALAAAAP